MQKMFSSFTKFGNKVHIIKAGNIIKTNKIKIILILWFDYIFLEIQMDPQKNVLNNSENYF